MLVIIISEILFMVDDSVPEAKERERKRQIESIYNKIDYQKIYKIKFNFETFQ